MHMFRAAWLAILALCLASPVFAQASGVTLFPANKSANVSPDTQLKLTFSSPPTIGSSGLIRIYDAADNSLVDTLDLSIPSSPNPSGRSTATTEAERQAMAAANKMENFQVNTIGGVDFHFFPIIVRGNTATIYLHNNRLKYGRTYIVKIDSGVLKDFPGVPDWTFSTRKAPPKSTATRVTVSADGKGDFTTVQGAIEWAPAKPAKPITIAIRNGVYEELVYVGGKSNLIIRGQDREKVQVGYPNNSAFNPSRGGPSRRPAFSIQDGADIQLSTFTITNHFTGQAEALLVRGERIVIDRMTLNGSGDALTTYGAIYMADSKLTGDGDTILGYAALYCLRCEIVSTGPFTWTRTPQGSHGNVFVDSTLIYTDTPLRWSVTPETPEGRKAPGVFARLPRNGPGSSAANFPYAEMVLINTRTQNVPHEGFGPVEEAPGFDSSNVRFMEHNTMDMDGRPIDLSKRHPIVKVLTQPKDAETIANYRDPAFVLGGWEPVVR